MKEFFKLNGQKIIITFFSYAIFYVLDQILLSPIEEIYLPEIVNQMSTVSTLFWVSRAFQEIITFYFMACFACWYITSNRKNKTMGKRFLSYFRPNKINLILMLCGYAIFYISNAILYLPINNLFLSEQELTGFPLTLTFIRLFFDLVTFYIVGSFAYWLVDYLKKK